MDAEEAAKELNKMEGGQPESHMRAEDILCEVLRANNLRKVAAAFEAAKDRIGFWYE